MNDNARANPTEAQRVASISMDSMKPEWKGMFILILSVFYPQNRLQC